MSIEPATDILKQTNSHRTGIGSLTQLAAVGPQDIHIHYSTENDEARSFQLEQQYTQHTPFALESNSVYSLQNAHFGQVYKFTVPFQKQHLINNITLCVEFPALNQQMYNATYVRYKNKLGYRLLKNIQILINNEIIESYTGQFLYILHALETDYEKQDALSLMMGVHESDLGLNGNRTTLYIPINIWYTKTMKQFFPLLSLHKQNVNIQFEFESLNNLIESDGDLHFVSLNLKLNKPKIKTQLIPSFQQILDPDNNEISNTLNGQLLIDYVILDTKERDIFLHTQQTHVYNLVKLQQEFITTDTVHIDLLFTLPVKQFITVFTHEPSDLEFLEFTGARLIFGTGDDSNNIMDYASPDILSLVEDYYHNYVINTENIYSYSFALNAFQSEPNGSVHFGNLNTKVVEIIGAKGKYVTIYARCYNIFTTNSGYGLVKFK